MMSDDRHSKAELASLIEDEDEKAKAEARNALKQFDLVINLIDEAIDPQRPFRLRNSKILSVHREALQGIDAYAGNFRPGKIEIGKSKHTPPEAHLVPGLMEEFCDYVNENWKEKPTLHLSAYALWRLNWIHPFTDGNGRTSRAISYLILCAHLKARLPGTKTIPHYIAENKDPYYRVLEKADENWKNGSLDLRELENLISSLLAKQLLEIHQKASQSGGGESSPPLLH